MYMFLVGAAIIFLVILKPLTKHLGIAEKTLIKYKNKIIILLILILISSFFSTILASVPAGTTGVIVSGPGIGKTLSQGINFKSPLDAVDIVPWSTQIREYNLIRVTSSDSISLEMNLIVRYHIEKAYTSEVRINNPRYEETINQVVRSVPLDIASQYTALDIISKKRLTLTEQIDAKIKEELSDSHIVIESCTVQKAELPENYKTSIENTKVAEQKLIQAEFEKNVTIKEAEAQAEAISILNQQISQSSENYLTWLYIRALTDPDSNVKWVVPEGIEIIVPSE